MSPLFLPETPSISRQIFSVARSPVTTSTQKKAKYGIRSLGRKSIELLCFDFDRIATKKVIPSAKEKAKRGISFPILNASI